MTPQEQGEEGQVERLLKRVPQPEPSPQFVEAVMRRVQDAEAPAPAAVRQPLWQPWAFIPRLGLGLAAAAFLAVVVPQQPTPVGTEALLLADWPDEAAWAFVNEAPEADVLLTGMAEPQ